MHHETGHAEAAISPLHCATVEMTKAITQSVFPASPAQFENTPAGGRRPSPGGRLWGDGSRARRRGGTGCPCPAPAFCGRRPYLPEWDGRCRPYGPGSGGFCRFPCLVRLEEAGNWCLYNPSHFERSETESRNRSLCVPGFVMQSTLPPFAQKPKKIASNKDFSVSLCGASGGALSCRRTRKYPKKSA